MLSHEPFDIGHGHRIQLTRWSPDRSIPANAERYANVPDIDPIGLIDYHKRPDNGEECWGGVTFDLPGVRGMGHTQAVWQVQSLDPLTISPSLLCMECGDHGFIREGKWVPA